jgi:hypothetical protein
MSTAIDHAGQSVRYGLMAEFLTPDELLVAARKARDAGYRKMDAFTPMPVEGLGDAIGFRSKAVSYFVFAGGVVGVCGGFALLYWIAVIAYPHNVGGRPLNSWPAFIPIMFECMVLIACLTAVVSMLALNRLPQPYHPVFNIAAFEPASQDRFFLCIEVTDRQFDFEGTRRFLEDLGPLEVYEVPA